MNDGSLPPIAPPPGVKTPGKPPYMLIGIGAVVLIVLAMMFSGHSPSATNASGAASGTDAPAARPAGGNPMFGTWTLLDANMAAYCKAEREFKSYADAKANNEVPAIYVVQPTYVEVSYGGPNSEVWDLHGPDDVTLRMSSPTSVGYSEVGAEAQTNCRYHRK
jgi:hypothetical protein